MHYDDIIVGSGEAGILSALKLLKSGRKVLLLEQANYPCPNNKAIRKGRFEFESTMYPFYLRNYDYEDSFKFIKNTLLNNPIHFTDPVANYALYLPGDNLDYVKYCVPFGINKFEMVVDQEIPESSQKIRQLFELGKEFTEAFNYIISKKELDNNFIKENFSNFVFFSDYTLAKGLDALEIKGTLRSVITSLWILLGSPESDLGFVHYISFFYNFIHHNVSIPVNTTYSICLALLDKYLELGGELKCNSMVSRIMVDNKQVNGVILSDGKRIYADNVIVNSNEYNVYNNLVAAEDRPIEAVKSINAREIGAKPFVVHLGLNVSLEELGLHSYMYLVYPKKNSDDVYPLMKDLNSNVLVVLCKNVLEDATMEGTCILELSTLFYDDAFSKNANVDNYNKYINEIALSLIEQFENLRNINIKEHIEEIEISTPVDFSAGRMNYDGNIFGFRLTKDDTLLGRMLNKSKERYISGLYITNGYKGDAYGPLASYYNGYRSTEKIKKLEGE